MIYTKEEFFMCYMSMTIYNIYSFLFIIVCIVCIIIYLLILYVVFAKAKEITLTNHFHQYRNTCHTCENASTKLIMV